MALSVSCAGHTRTKSHAALSSEIIVVYILAESLFSPHNGTYSLQVAGQSVHFVHVIL